MTLYIVECALTGPEFLGMHERERVPPSRDRRASGMGSFMGDRESSRRVPAEIPSERRAAEHPQMSACGEVANGQLRSDAASSRASGAASHEGSAQAASAKGGR